MNTRECDLEDPKFPTLIKKKVDDKVTDDLIDSLFSVRTIDGDNVIEQDSKLSLCDGSLQVCCHPKTTAPPTTISMTTTAQPAFNLQNLLIFVYWQILIIH